MGNASGNDSNKGDHNVSNALLPNITQFKSFRGTYEIKILGFDLSSSFKISIKQILIGHSHLLYHS